MKQPDNNSKTKMDISEGGFDWKTFIEQLVAQEQDTHWHPFPEHYVNTRPRISCSIPQISTDNPYVHVIAKLTNNFEILQQYGLDEEQSMPKVICWNDISSLTTKMAAKTVKAGLEREYTSIYPNITIKFQSVSVGNRQPLLFSNKDPDILIYHVMDPTISQHRKLKSKASANNTLVSSFSTSQLNSIAEGASASITHSPVNVIDLETPVYADLEALQLIAENNSQQNSIFIFDCSFAKRALKAIRSKERPFIIFASTSEILNYSPHLPCDLFTSCLLTPAKVALLWQSQRVGHFHSGILKEIEMQTLIDQLSDSPQSADILAMLEGALDAIADKIALDILVSDFPFFCSLFRKDAITARMFYNFMFATRVMNSLAMKPSSYPSIPDSTQHPLWNSFDLQADRALFALINSFSSTNIPKSLFSIDDLLSEGMGRLESWLRFPQKGRKVPNEICYLPMLLRSEKFFPYAIAFCSNFIQISDNTVKIFLYTRSFPELSFALENFLDNTHPATITAFSFVVADSVLMAPQLKSYFKPKTSFWFQYISSKYELLVVASLSCLLIFLDDNEQIKMYKNSNIIDDLEKLIIHKIPRVRCLANLILTQLDIPMNDAESGLLEHEPNPLCRAALVSRMVVTINKMEKDDMARDALLFDVVGALNDLYPLVREEAVTGITHAFQHESNDFFFAIANCIKDEDFQPTISPIPPILCTAIRALIFEPSLRMNERLVEFFQFLALKIDHFDAATLKSNLKTSCLSKLAHLNPNPDESPTIFGTEALVSDSASSLIGKPDISPSGLFTCGDRYGKIFCQTFSEEMGVWKRHKELYECFKPAFKLNNISTHFKRLHELRETQENTLISYLKFVDDSKLLAVSNRSQVIVLDSKITEDSVCSFWADHPNKCNFCVSDYNHSSFSLLHTTGKENVNLFDLETHQKVNFFRINQEQKISGMQWLKPYSTLFYVAQNDITVFDIRMKRPVSVISDAGKKFVGGNISHTLPLFFITGKEQGVTSMYDLRTMSLITSRTHSKPFKEFDVHKHLPFSVAIADSLISINYEGGNLIPQQQNIGFVPQSFSLHHNESVAAVRVGNKIQSAKIVY